MPEIKVETRHRILVRVREGVFTLVPSENRAPAPNVTIATDPKLSYGEGGSVAEWLGRRT